MIMGDEFGQRPTQRRFPSRINFERPSDFTVRTQRSATAFKFGLLAESRTLSMPCDSISLRNSGQNLGSRSWSNFLYPFRKPIPSMVTVPSHLLHPVLVRMARDARHLDQ